MQDSGYDLNLLVFSILSCSSSWFLFILVVHLWVWHCVWQLRGDRFEPLQHFKHRFMVLTKASPCNIIDIRFDEVSLGACTHVTGVWLLTKMVFRRFQHLSGSYAWKGAGTDVLMVFGCRVWPGLSGVDCSSSENIFVVYHRLWVGPTAAGSMSFTIPLGATSSYSYTGGFGQSQCFWSLYRSLNTH